MGRGGQHSLDSGQAHSAPVLPEAALSLADDPLFAPFAQQTFNANDFASNALAGSQNTAQASYIPRSPTRLSKFYVYRVYWSTLRLARACSIKSQRVLVPHLVSTCKPHHVSICKGRAAATGERQLTLPIPAVFISADLRKMRGCVRTGKGGAAAGRY